MKKFKYEEAIKRLEEITNKLESGELTLEESLKLYEEGIQLKQQCYEYLKKAEGKIYKIINNDGKETLEEVDESSILNKDD
ncbi:MAG: exodeoxyribonuclease 7 small subunit [Leptospiraceae bacterium]|nr:MAG: exodeoxyribonuclease 7 small subunit [Leptospiraceae bacterium]